MSTSNDLGYKLYPILLAYCKDKSKEFISGVQQGKCGWLTVYRVRCSLWSVREYGRGE